MLIGATTIDWPRRRGALSFVYLPSARSISQSAEFEELIETMREEGVEVYQEEEKDDSDETSIICRQFVDYLARKEK
jgi:hypothetical protein